MIEKAKTPALAILLVISLIVILALIPLPGGDDWEVFREAGRRVLSGEPLYGQPIYEGFYYYNAPWFAVLIAPLSLLPSQLGRSILLVSTLVLTTLVVRRWEAGLIKPVLALLSPPILYIVLHGQIDAIVLAGVLLPTAYWGLVAFTKPQVSLGLLFGVEKPTLPRMLGVTAVGFLLSFLVFGLWPVDLLRQPGPVGGHNLWLGLWPFQIPAGVALGLLGVRRKDERLLLAASPFFLPYAATSSLLGPWIVMSTLLKDWEAIVVLLAWWGVTVYRYWGGLPL